VLLLLLLSSLLRAEPSVVLVTLDGVRWQEFLNNAPDPNIFADKDPTFPKFWASHAQEGVLLENASISNLAALSLPAYQSIMAGHSTFCFTNKCGRTEVQTLPERLQKAGRRLEVVTSWPGVELAVQRASGTVPVHVAAADADTWAAAKLALSRKPSFLYIAWSGADEAAHAADKAGYLAALRRYDGWLDELIALLDKDATLIVTTDHGRGNGTDWISHGGRPSAARIWLYAKGPRTPAGQRLSRGGSHAQIAPTIEALLGLSRTGSTLPGVLP
jgi:arylsulfatase A-like enzyme